MPKCAGDWSGVISLKKTLKDSLELAKYGVEDFALTKDLHPDLLEPIHFGKFIKPHLVTDPRGTYPLPVKSEEGGRDGRAN